MTTAHPSTPSAHPSTLSPLTVADLLERLDGIPPERVLLRPVPGSATEQDVLDMDAHANRLCELIDGVLVEKSMGIEESILAALLMRRVGQFVEARKRGVIAGADGTIRLLPGQVRMPDVAFYSWARLPNGRVPREPIPAIAPDLAVEVLSKSNTQREMSRKLREYFQAGTELVWYVDPSPRTVTVHTRTGETKVLGMGETLDGGAVLPGFALDLQELFAVLDQTGPA